MRRTVILVVVLSCLAGGCWRQAGWDGAHTGYNRLENVLTVGTVDSLRRAWVVDTGGSGPATPIVMGDLVYTTGGEAVVAYDIATGALRWRRVPEVFGSRVRFSAITGEDDGITSVYDVIIGGGTMTLNPRDGSTVRERLPSLHSAAGPSVYRPDVSAAFAGGFSAAGWSGTLEYGERNGLIAYAHNLTTPSLIGRHAVIGSRYDVRSFPLDSCPPLPIDYAGCGHEWFTELPSPARTPVGLSETRIAVSGEDGDVAVLDATTGQVVFRAHTGSTMATEPAVADGVMYVGAVDGKLHAFEAGGCGAPVCEARWTADAGGGVISYQPAVGADVVYVGTAKGTVAAFARDGCGTAVCQPRWTAAVDEGGGAAAVVGPVVSSGMLFAGTATGKLAAFAPRDTEGRAWHTGLGAG